jgi:uncharacterized DUF497 family protein
MDAFEWDERKRRATIQERFLDFVDAPSVLSGPCLRAAAKTVGGENREIAIGMLADVCVAIIYTRRGSAIRVISMRKARKGERNQFEKVFGG